MSQTKHIPPAGEFLYPDHELDANCWCKPERHATHTKRNKQGHYVNVSFYHHSKTQTEGDSK